MQDPVPLESAIAERPPFFISSTSFVKVAEALCKAQAEITAAEKSSENPHFKSKYADLASVWAACRGPLTKYGLSVLQLPGNLPGGRGIELKTVLMHSSGEWIGAAIALEVNVVNPQTVGSALTYLRRYMLASMTSVAPDDDDGEAAAQAARARTERGRDDGRRENRNRQSYRDRDEPRDTGYRERPPSNGNGNGSRNGGNGYGRDSRQSPPPNAAPVDPVAQMTSVPNDNPDADEDSPFDRWFADAIRKIRGGWKKNKDESPGLQDCSTTSGLPIEPREILLAMLHGCHQTGLIPQAPNELCSVNELCSIAEVPFVGDPAAFEKAAWMGAKEAIVAVKKVQLAALKKTPAN